jgi:hypothetical protein
MNTFVKIGLPWVISIASVFYLGLKLGSHSQEKNNTIGDNQTQKQVTKTIQSPKIPNLNLKEFSDREIESSFATPELPPNLVRIMEGGDIIERLGAFLDAVRAMDKGNVTDVISAFEALPKGYGRHLEMKLLMRSWSTIDPISALAYANESLDPKSERRFGVSEILAGWASRNPDEAIAWAQTNSTDDTGVGSSLLFGVIKGLAEKDLDRADEVFKDLPEGNARWQASTFLAQKFSEIGVEKAIAWANNFPKSDERMRETILGQIGAKLARQDIEATAKWVEAMKDDKASFRIMDNLLTQWVPKDPARASQWVSEIQENEKRFHGIHQLTSRWALTDPVATAEWLNTFPASAKMDPVVSEFVNRISTRDPEGATGWANSIVDPETKQKALNKALNAWNRIDPESAKNWQKVNMQESK